MFMRYATPHSTTAYGENSLSQVGRNYVGQRLVVTIWLRGRNLHVNVSVQKFFEPLPLVAIGG